jgi:hypothetical protein
MAELPEAPKASPEILVLAAKDLADLYRTDTMFYVYGKEKAVTAVDFWGNSSKKYPTLADVFMQLRDISHNRREHPSVAHGAVESQFAQVENLDTKLFLIDLAMKRLADVPGKNKSILEMEDLEPVPSHMAEELGHDAYMAGGLKEIQLERVMLSILNDRLQLSEPIEQS